MDIDAVHGSAVTNFVNLKLTYRFSVAQLREPPTNGPVRLRFLFSKPSDAKPEPEIVVAMDLEVLSRNGSTWTYALYFEGQKYRRVITLDDKQATAGVFNEHQIDKIYQQKANVRQRRLWEA